jgi:cytochrome c oxidase assembly factor CtaG
MTAHMVEHMVLTLVLAPAFAAGLRVRVPLPPAIALLQFTVVVLVVHVPAVWDATHGDVVLRVAVDAATLASAVVFWRPALDPEASLGALARAVYLMLAMPAMSLVGVLLDFVDRPLYDGVSLADQHRAGALMWGVGSAVTAVILVAAVWAHLLREEKLEVASR